MDRVLNATMDGGAGNDRSGSTEAIRSSQMGESATTISA
jgi:hypothetical protein